ncbi:MAG: cobalt/nickel transport system permease protein [Solirubrobacteraceae bacterium]|jgi:cobalt/nickel transport system permease protein|nr:cobalt/nickel transport system permease protein [Solirubrobacteraceae bacterium]MEA2290738.1 cobalt/nickel transport system permease protein [Solirubrobacteraceae bacterium]
MTLAHAAAQAPVETALHRAAPECKLVALLVFVLAVALVPHGAVVPYAVDAALLAAVAAWARVDPRFLARRLLIEVPFIAFVVLLPFVSGGPRVEVLGIGLSEAGLWTAGGIAAKATLAVLATGVLAATTTAPEIIAGMERLRAPRALTAVAGFALRYVQVVVDEMRRLQLARVARGDDPRWLWQARTVARTAGTLAVRCFERGERVHTAMLARGFDGRMPVMGLAAAATAPAWMLAAALVLPAAAMTLAA